ncbi:hypothetical protein PTSG_10926 [Salpingoeca rosetta]|uniref:Cilia- and flagella-associated protein 58 central coiled coil domain-containing protein n=1 Tax=Salpingoeca rosetta (strain ATCC 50818 / BSB-021) TaxID=946362 RepID=F2URE7_SALR5|nr:uncharacterized protein PTSG_10926 [Salpingoeca rosetta]EGD80250.1 hypothetical protein PTSG_10926 [Salpingoeca rosetta]|eukprot:XP_004988312.1 hypothetical protein PTSG_10926 [Salpingoeca rosetta]
MSEDGAMEDELQDFAEALDRFSDDPAFSPFREEYENLLEALEKAHDNERRLESKCRELNAELVSNAAKVQSALQNNRDDEMSVAHLQKEVDEAWKLVDQARENEAKLKEQLEEMRDEMVKLNEEIEEQTSQAHQKGEELTALGARKKELEIERENLLEQASKLNQQITDLREEQNKLEQGRAEATARVDELEEMLTQKQSESDREARKKAHLERELATRRQELEEKQSDATEAGEQLKETQMMVQELTGQLDEKEAELSLVQQEMMELAQKNSRLEKQVEESMMANQNAFEDMMKMKQELKQREDELLSLKGDCQKLQKSNEAVARKLKASEDKRLELISSRDLLKGELGALERELEASKRQNESDRKRLDEMARNRDMLTKKVLTSSKETEAQEVLVKMHENTKKTLEAEIAGFKEEAAKQRKIIFQLEKERDKYINDASATQARAVQAMEEVKLADAQVLDLKKKLADAEAKLKQQQSLYEQVRSDRNMYSKNLIEAQDEIAEMKRKLKIMNHQIDQLKEEISTKEAHLQKEHHMYETLDTQKNKLKAELDRLKIVNATHLKSIAEKTSEKEALEKLIKDAEEQYKRLQDENQRVMKMRDSFAIQLTRRNAELELLYQKLQIQASTLEKGEVQYRQREEDIRLLKVEIKRLKRERSLLSKNVSNIEELRRELFKVQRELLKEKTRCKALEEEVQTPMNVHRWRKLEGSDPKTFEMIQKIQTLQKRLIQKTSEVVEKELKIQEKERQYVELKTILARQPGPEVAEQLQVYQQAVKEKTRQLKSMASEVNMYRAQVDEHKFELDRVVKELHDLKKKYFEQKKKDMLRRDKEQAMRPVPPPEHIANRPRFTGGGFSLKTPTT